MLNHFLISSSWISSAKRSETLQNVISELSKNRCLMTTSLNHRLVSLYSGSKWIIVGYPELEQAFRNAIWNRRKYPAIPKTEMHPDPLLGCRRFHKVCYTWASHVLRRFRMACTLLELSCFSSFECSQWIFSIKKTWMVARPSKSGGSPQRHPEFSLGLLEAQTMQRKFWMAPLWCLVT